MSITIQADTPAPALNGPNHTQVLGALHATLRPRTYLEIGVDRGETLRAAHCPTIAIDAALKLDPTAIGDKPACMLFQMQPDRFFDQYDPETLLGAKVDLGYLNGMNLFEFMLRDFINLERSCRRNSLIVLHDCIPTDLYLARRHRLDEALVNQTRLRGGWCGDVWKAVLILKKYRPDLRITAFNAALTGLILVTNLDPDSTVLSDNYAQAVEILSPVTLQDYGLTRYLDELAIKDARLLGDAVHLAQWAWM